MCIKHGRFRQPEPGSAIANRVTRQPFAATAEGGPVLSGTGVVFEREANHLPVKFKDGQNVFQALWGQGMILRNRHTALGLENSLNQVQAGFGNGLLYPDMEKGSRSADTFGLQLPAYVSTDANLSADIETEHDLARYRSNADAPSKRDTMTEVERSADHGRHTAENQRGVQAVSGPSRTKKG
ncbi:hypothetical protein V6667_03310 [Neisseria leonii]|uniref:hypothetical protein n=1 Tax=Neisseria leonii TaxID=2995413 RepID=UPI0030CCA75D